MSDRLPPHITEDDVRLITKMVTPTVIEAVRAESRASSLEDLANDMAGTLHTRIIDSFIETLRSRAALERMSL